MDWSGGYVAGIGYTHGFYRELTPSVQIFALLARGVETGLDTERFTYCDIGCGQGFNVNLLAAAHPNCEFHATDFNPSHIAGARKLAKEAGSTNIHFYDDSFEDFGRRDLPDFDIIVLHGIFSWVSAENRRHIVDFIARKLKIGGYVFVSYNCQPGWAATIPLRDLMLQFAGDPAQPILPRIEAALTKMQAFFDANPGYIRVHPALEGRFNGIKTQPRNYLAHEYFNRDWTIFYHTDVARELSAAKLNFAATTQLLEHVDHLQFSAEQQKLLNETQDPGQREVMRDFILNQQFRRDLFVKGGVPLVGTARNDRIADLRFVLSAPPADVPRKVTTFLGEISLNSEVFGAVIEAFGAGPRTIRQLLQQKSTKALGFAPILDAVMILVGMGHLHPCLEAAGDAKRGTRAKAFNKALLERARTGGELVFLASPLTGGGIFVDRFSQLFLLARQLKHENPAAFVWQCMADRGERPMQNGQVVMTAEEGVPLLTQQYEAFAAKQLPVLQQLGVA